ncbi:MAG: signal peptidase II [Clostridia bacterium]|nr:signal peptidase II [Clostridia bacterium]
MLLCILTVIGVIALDQLTKLWVLDALLPIGTYRLWDGVLHFTYVENRGAAFGMLANHRWVFMTVSTVAIIAMFLYVAIAKPKGKLELVSLSFIIGGGIGNMIDRIFRGFVVDFIDVTCINFFVFNVADSFVCVGAALLVLSVLLETKAADKGVPHAD